MPKVVHIVPGKANINRLNGVNKVVYSVATESHKAGHTIEVWGLSQSQNNPFNHPFPFRVFSCHPRVMHLPRELKEAIDSQPDGTIFHLHGALVPVYSTISGYLRRIKQSYIITPHGALQKRSLRRGAWYKYVYIYLFERKLLKHAKFIHCITNLERDHIHALCGKSKTRIIPNGTNLQAETVPNINRDEPLFLYMGRFDKRHKGLDIALKAFSIFHQQYRKGRFILAGDGADKESLVHAIARYRLKPFVSLLPPQYGTDKDDLLAKTDIFVHPSRWDVMPTSCLEAAIAGKPLIISRATGLGYKVEQAHAGWVTVTLHASELAQKFTQAYKAWASDKLPAISKNSHKMIIDQDLLWPSLIKQYYSKLYNHD